ncbi:MAG TPA: hypothetical protein VIJ07_25610 [Dermatophilaceae bacterium]|jgi:hypothetical protein
MLVTLTIERPDATAVRQEQLKPHDVAVVIGVFEGARDVTVSIEPQERAHPKPGVPERAYT